MRTFLLFSISILIGVALAWLTLFFLLGDSEPPLPVTCSSDEQCGGTVVSERFCRDGDVYGNGQANRCLNPGQPGSSCSTTYGAVLVEACENGCGNGACL